MCEVREVEIDSRKISMKRLAFGIALMLLSSCTLDFSYSYQYYSVFEDAPENCILETHDIFIVNAKPVFQYTCRDN